VQYRKQQKDPAAWAIVETLLLKTANAMLAGDFEALNACFHLPFSVETLDSKLVVETEAEHRKLFDRMIEGYQTRGVTDIVRTCEAAALISPTRIQSIHTSHVMAGNQRIDDPMAALAAIERFGPDWLITSAQYVASDIQPVIRAIERHGNTDQ